MNIVISCNKLILLFLHIIKGVPVCHHVSPCMRIIRSLMLTNVVIKTLCTFDSVSSSRLRHVQPVSVFTCLVLHTSREHVCLLIVMSFTQSFQRSNMKHCNYHYGLFFPKLCIYTSILVDIFLVM